MKKLKLVLSVLLLIMAFQSEATKKTHLIKPHAPLCYASDEVHKGTISAPEKFKLRLKSAQAGSANIEVNYFGFSTEAQTAFAYAVSIWESLISSPVTIRMKASWTSLDSGVLGSCSPTDYLENFDGAPVPNTFYPIPLAEKLAGKDLNASNETDMEAQFNSSFTNWYFGTDGNCPLDKYDFVSVVLHEIGHGLGFIGMCYKTTSDLGAYGWDTNDPGIYDLYMVNSDNNYLTDESLFPNFSTSLLDQFQSGIIYFKSEWAKAQLNGNYPRLYSPSPWDEGSSLYHLNENTYLPLNPNSLMTPAFGRGEAIHDPGPATMAMFEEMGWLNTSISHNELPDTEDTNTPLTVKASVVSDAGLDSTSVAVVFTTATFEQADTLTMNWSSATNLFSAQIPVTGAGEIKYFLMAKDIDGRTYLLPRNAPTDYFNVIVGQDETPPSLTHKPVKLMRTSQPDITFLALATDNIGISSVVLQYSINKAAFQSAGLTNTENSNYSTTLSFPGLADGDSIRYRLIATDVSSSALQTILPADGYYTISVEGTYDAVSTYSNNFDVPNRDFISEDFYMGTESGFDNASLNSSHPYASPEKNGASIEYTCMLKYPITLETDGKMTFDEVVLVEPGETGSVYGSDTFYDYVIVEGSLDGETNWLPLADGYDSRANTNWLTTYNSAIDGNNSTAVGTKELYAPHEISLTDNGNFSAGQNIFIRFRLFSDPFANGWGWAVDNLVIQDNQTAVSDIENPDSAIRIYPNPATNIIYIEGKLTTDPGNLTLQISSISGQLIWSKKLTAKNNEILEELNVSSLSPGLYLLKLQTESGTGFTEKIIKK